MASILGVHVDPINYALATAQIIEWQKAGKGRYVCVANTHMIMEGRDSATFRGVINGADLVTPDGMPLVWMLRLKGQRGQRRVYGPTLMAHVLEAAAREYIPVGLYGGRPEVVRSLVSRLTNKYPQLKIVYTLSPPFRALSPEEDRDVCNKISQSDARILFVGLGCPKQERWMAAHRGKIPVVMIGVGAAFDFLAGLKKQAPPWMQNLGMEWLFRLMHEPRRLWKRYLYHNPRFVVLALAELLGLWSP